MNINRRNASKLIFWNSVLAANFAHAQNNGYPNKPINFIIASVAGGILDTVGRMVAKEMQSLGQPVVVQNIPGGGSTIGTAAVFRAPADGYTIGMVATSHGINPNVYAKLPYDTLHDFLGISQSVKIYNLLLVSKKSGIHSVEELIGRALKTPGSITYASAGNGQSNHLSAELFAHAAGIQMEHVPYKGSAAALNDVLAGNVDCMFMDPLSAAQHLDSGRIKAIAVSSEQRLPNFPAVPTFKELKLDFDANSWLGVIVRRGTPPAIVELLGKAAASAVLSPQSKEKLTALGVIPVGSSPKAFDEFLRNEVARYAKAVKIAKITAS